MPQPAAAISFLVEVYTPPTIDIGDVEAKASRAAAELSAAGTPVRYVRSIFVPDDETCFHLFEAASSVAVGEATRRAGFTAARITPAIETGLVLEAPDDYEPLVSDR